MEGILKLLCDIQEGTGVAYLFITHDLAAVRAVSHECAVMQLGKVVEQGPVQQILKRPWENYTQTLASAYSGRQR